jgi:hypothetical protein
MVLISYARWKNPNWTNFFASVNVNSEAKIKAQQWTPIFYLIGMSFHQSLIVYIF